MAKTASLEREMSDIGSNPIPCITITKMTNKKIRYMKCGRCHEERIIHANYIRASTSLCRKCWLSLTKANRRTATTDYPPNMIMHAANYCSSCGRVLIGYSNINMCKICASIRSDTRRGLIVKTIRYRGRTISVEDWIRNDTDKIPDMR